MSHPKNKNLQNNLRASKYLLELVNTYVEDEKVQADIVESYRQKKPKSYAQVFNGLFRFSKVTLMFFHGLSFLIATPLIFSLAFQFMLQREQSEIKGLFDAVLQDFSNVFTPLFLIPALITCLILFLLEYGQHVTLNSLFDIYFQWGKKIIPGLAILALLFSSASVFTSGFGAKEFVQVSKGADPAALADLDSQIDEARKLRMAHSDRGNATIKKRDQEVEYLRAQRAEFVEGNTLEISKYGQIMMAIALFFEIMIITNTFNIHNYQFKTARETEMVNDLMNGYTGSLTLNGLNGPGTQGSVSHKLADKIVNPKKVSGQLS